MKIWHIFSVWGVVLLIGTIGAADMGAIGETRIVAQFLFGIGLIILSYISFVVACNRWCKNKWEKYGTGRGK